MLIKLLPDQITQVWDQLAPLMERSLVPTALPSNEGLTNILLSLLKGDLQCWVYIDGGSIMGIATTSVSIDRHTGTKSLLIYSLTGVRQLTRDIIKIGFEKFKEYAKGQGCDQVLAYTNIDSIIKAGQVLGAETDFTLLKWRI